MNTVERREIILFPRCSRKTWDASRGRARCDAHVELADRRRKSLTGPSLLRGQRQTHYYLRHAAHRMHTE